jgi:hypothetical protein
MVEKLLARNQREQVAAAGHTGSTRRHIPEDGILHSDHRENLKSYIFKILVFKNDSYYGTFVITGLLDSVHRPVF